MFFLAHFEVTLDISRKNLLAHKNITISYYVQVNSLWLKTLGVPLILLLMVHYVQLLDIKKKYDYLFI